MNRRNKEMFKKNRNMNKRTDGSILWLHDWVRKKKRKKIEKNKYVQTNRLQQQQQHLIVWRKKKKNDRAMIPDSEYYAEKETKL